jgi:4-amino-4-deoxy-L-arabinose transferase-like glycosyltransferase
VFRTDLVGRHVWRQTQTQTVVVNFYEEDFNILNPRLNSRGSGDGIRRLEFPAMQWMFACFYKIFGNHLIITRILSFAVGIFSVWGMYFFLNTLFKNRLTALVGAWALNFSPAFFYHTLNPMPDNLALCCSIWGLAFFFQMARRTQNGVFLGFRDFSEPRRLV